MDYLNKLKNLAGMCLEGFNTAYDACASDPMINVGLETTADDSYLAELQRSQESESNQRTPQMWDFT